jgi:hypothetical protein
MAVPVNITRPSEELRAIHSRICRIARRSICGFLRVRFRQTYSETSHLSPSSTTSVAGVNTSRADWAPALKWRPNSESRSRCRPATSVQGLNRVVGVCWSGLSFFDIGAEVGLPHRASQTVEALVTTGHDDNTPTPSRSATAMARRYRCVSGNHGCLAIRTESRGPRSPSRMKNPRARPA